MTWVEVFIAFVVSHLVGDYLLQTNWQALHKRGGLARGDRDARRALFTHVTLYTLCFVPALVVADLGVELVWVIPAIFIPHLIQDDGRLLQAYMKGSSGWTRRKTWRFRSPSIRRSICWRCSSWRW